MESTEKQDVWESLVSPIDVLKEMGLLTEDADSQEGVWKRERYWSVKTHYPNIDKLFNGFKSGDVVGIGGKQAVGKSALALNLAFSMAYHGTKVCLFSFEMPSEEVVTRLMAKIAGIEISALRSGDLTQEQYEAVGESVEVLGRLPIEIYDPPSMKVDAIRDAARNSLCGCDEGILIIDCLQLVDPSRDCGRYEDNDEKMDLVAISLKRLAMELRAPIIVTTQLDRTDSLDDAYPLSGHADIVMFLDHAKEDEFCSEIWNPMDIHVAKFRQGPIGGTLQLAFLPQWMSFWQIGDSSPLSSGQTPLEGNSK